MLLHELSPILSHVLRRACCFFFLLNTSAELLDLLSLTKRGKLCLPFSYLFKVQSCTLVIMIHSIKFC